MNINYIQRFKTKNRFYNKLNHSYIQESKI